jgi:cytochrome o ubiquinol oxidase subunit IV
MSRNATAAHGTLGSYVAGFIFSLVLTGVAYGLVTRHALSHRSLLAAVAGLAVVQLLVQLVFFLNLDQEGKPRWNLQVLLFAVLVVVIVVGGSLWIMYNLSYHMATPDQTNQYLQSQDGL